MKSNILVSLSIMLSLAGCKSGGDTGDTGDTGARGLFTVDNEGVACLVDDGTDDLSTGTVNVMLADCLTGCAGDLTANCEAVVIGDSIEVTATGEYSAPLGNANCLAVCVELTAQCSVSGISSDVTTLTYADASVEVDFPSQDRTCTDGW